MATPGWTNGIIGRTVTNALSKRKPCTWCKQTGKVNDPAHPGRTMACPACGGKGWLK